MWERVNDPQDVQVLIPGGCEYFKWLKRFFRASQVALVVKNLPANAGDLRVAGLIARLGRSPGGGHGNPFQYSCLENLMHRGYTVHEVPNSQT